MFSFAGTRTNINVMKQNLLLIYVVLMCFSACNLPTHLYLGVENKNLFDSSEIRINRKNRLPYTGFYDYKTTMHRAGNMSKNGKVNSIGIISSYRSTYTYSWQGEFSFNSSTDSTQVKYTSTVSDEIIGDYAMFSPMRMLGLHRQGENNVALTVTGTVYQHLDSSIFQYYNQSLLYTDLYGGYLLYKNDSILLKSLDSGLTKRNTLVNKRYGYGLFTKHTLIAAVDFENKPMKLYIRKDLANELKNTTVAFLAVIIGNKKIVTRKSTFLKRLL